MSEKADIYKKKALNTIQALNYGIKELKIEKNIYSTYEQGCKDSLKHLGIKPRRFKKEDWFRLKFEILCFAISQCLLMGGPKYFANKKDEFSRYNAALQDHLYRYLHLKKITNIRELVIKEIKPTIKYGYGECLDPFKRIAEYAKAESVERLLKILGRNIGYAIDPDNLAITEIIALNFAELILNLVDTTLKHIFSE